MVCHMNKESIKKCRSIYSVQRDFKKFKLSNLGVKKEGEITGAYAEVLHGVLHMRRTDPGLFNITPLLEHPIVAVPFTLRMCCTPVSRRILPDTPPRLSSFLFLLGLCVDLWEKRVIFIFIKHDFTTDYRVSDQAAPRCGR